MARPAARNQLMRMALYFRVSIQFGLHCAQYSFNHATARLIRRSNNALVFTIEINRSNKQCPVVETLVTSSHQFRANCSVLK
jgi:hypothetical protein